MPVENPSGTYPNKGWYLNGSLSIQAQTEVQDALPSSVGAWGARERLWSRPNKTFSVTGKCFTFEESEAWRVATEQPAASVSVETVDGQIIAGFPTSYSRQNIEGSELYDITMTVEQESNEI